MFKRNPKLSQTKKVASVYIHKMNRKIARHLNRLLKRAEVKTFRKYDDYDSHIIDDMPLTLSR